MAFSIMMAMMYSVPGAMRGALGGALGGAMGATIGKYVNVAKLAGLKTPEKMPWWKSTLALPFRGVGAMYDHITSSFLQTLLGVLGGPVVGALVRGMMGLIIHEFEASVVGGGVGGLFALLMLDLCKGILFRCCCCTGVFTSLFLGGTFGGTTGAMVGGFKGYMGAVNFYLILLFFVVVIIAMAFGVRRMKKDV